MITLVGVDPGSETGLVAVTAPDGGSLTSPGAHWLTHATLRISQAKRQPPVRRDANLYERLAEWFRLVVPSVVVFEEPVDAATTWRGYRHQQRGTAFRLGAYYGLAVAACQVAVPTATLASYPATAIKGRRGWMEGKPRTLTLTHAQHLARRLGAPPEVLDGTTGSEHLLMALGVLTFYVAQTAPVPVPVPLPAGR